MKDYIVDKAKNFLCFIDIYADLTNADIDMQNSEAAIS